MIAVELRDDERVRRARERLKRAKSAFSAAARATMQGKADPNRLAQALRAVDTARAALRQAEVKR